MVGSPQEVVRSAVESFGNDTRLPTHLQPYISSVTASNVAVSGPPSVLARLLDESLSRAQTAWLSIHGPFHAPHLYSQSDVDAILAPCDPRILERTPSNAMISARDGERVDAASGRDLFERAVQDMLVSPLRWDRVLQASTSIFPGHVVVQPILAPSQSLSSILTNAGRRCEVRTADARAGGTAGTKPKLAISKHCFDFHAPGPFNADRVFVVGYSGRFPSAASADELWENVLLPGLDVHREIPADRFDVDAHFDASGKTKNTSKVRDGRMSSLYASQTEPLVDPPWLLH